MVKTVKHSKYFSEARKLIAIATWIRAAGMCKRVYCSITIIVKGEIQSLEQTSFRGNIISGKILLQIQVEIATVIWFKLRTQNRGEEQEILFNSNKNVSSE